jgi:hypothetical protein
LPLHVSAATGRHQKAQLTLGRNILHVSLDLRGVLPGSEIETEMLMQSEEVVYIRNNYLKSVRINLGVCCASRGTY